MGAICNGLALSKLRPFGSGYLIFSDYMKPPIRLAALMELPVVFILTHDSIGVGEDGPTHQPIGQILGLRSEEHTSELQSLMRISYAVFCLKKKNSKTIKHQQ